MNELSSIIVMGIDYSLDVKQTYARFAAVCVDQDVKYHNYHRQAHRRRARRSVGTLQLNIFTASLACQQLLAAAEWPSWIPHWRQPLLIFEQPHQLNRVRFREPPSHSALEISILCTWWDKHKYVVYPSEFPESPPMHWDTIPVVDAIVSSKERTVTALVELVKALCP